MKRFHPEIFFLDFFGASGDYLKDPFEACALVADTQN